MAKTLKDLALALLNATLILLALCLFLAWKVADRANELTASFASTLERVTPLRDEMSGIQIELHGLRTDLAALRSGGEARSSEALQRLEIRLAALDKRLSGAGDKITTLTEQPEVLVEKFIDTAADALTRSVSDLRGCVPPA